MSRMAIGKTNGLATPAECKKRFLASPATQRCRPIDVDLQTRVRKGVDVSTIEVVCASVWLPFTRSTDPAAAQRSFEAGTPTGLFATSLSYRLSWGVRSRI